MNELFSVTGKTALITGATSGLGRMIAEGFVGAGVKVYACARSAADCQTVAHELSAVGAVSAVGPVGDCVALAADISSEAGCRDLADRVAGLEDRLDILVNAAGGTWMAPIDSFDEQGWDLVLGVNVKGPFHLTRFLLPLLRAAASDNDPARIINIGSVSATRIPDMDNYSYPATKAALHTLTRHLARRLAPAVTVNAIAPGPFPSRMMSDLLDRHGEQIAASAPMRRIGRPSDIAGAALYLASPAASWVTGTVLTVDGGLGTT
jgi:NAD(P)-dependent dehydrogenase (short-subunit alcohol dehydrogenase family)